MLVELHNDPLKKLLRLGIGQLQLGTPEMT